MTGMFGLLDGGPLTIPGSTPFGGQITPLDSERRSLSGGPPVLPSARGGDAPFGGQSGLVAGAVRVSPCPYKGEVEIEDIIAIHAAAFFKLRIRDTPLEKTQTSRAPILFRRSRAVERRTGAVQRLASARWRPSQRSGESRMTSQVIEAARRIVHLLGPWLAQRQQPAPNQPHRAVGPPIQLAALRGLYDSLDPLSERRTLG